MAFFVTPRRQHHTVSQGTAMQQQQQEELRDWFLSLQREQQRQCLLEMSLSIADVVAKLSSRTQHNAFF